MTSPAPRPLSGISVVEFAGIGPSPFCAMLLADFGASITRIDRPSSTAPSSTAPSPDPVLGRGRTSVELDLKNDKDRDTAMDLVSRSHVVLEGFRPGVMERLGLGPADCHQANSRLVYARLTGWGQEGPLRHRAGHDINYIAMAGVLASIGGDKPTIPLNLIGDYAGGALLAAFGILAALRAVEHGERDMVVDSSMRAGATYLMSYQFQELALGAWQDRRQANLLDGSAPFYDTYRCADETWIAVGAIEDKFYEQLLQGLDLQSLSNTDRFEPANHDILKREFAARFRARTRDDWLEHFEKFDACVSPVLTMTDLASDRTYTRERVAGVAEPIPAPAISSRSTIADSARAGAKATRFGTTQLYQ